MPAKPIIDVSKLNLDAPQFSKSDVLALNPQRYEFEQLDAVIDIDIENGTAVGFKVQKNDEFWVNGHIPGRPLMPGVLMIEMAAQMSSFFYHKKVNDNGDKFFGFGGVDKIKFRGNVHPGETLIMAIKLKTFRSRIAIFEAQAFTDKSMVFEGIITGVIF